MKLTELMTVTEISVAIATIAFVLLVIFLIITLLKIKKSIEFAQLDFHRVSLELSGLISKTTEISSEIQKKSEHMFDTLSSFLEPHHNTSKQPDLVHKVPFKLIGWITSSLFLVKKTKDFIKGMVK